MTLDISGVFQSLPGLLQVVTVVALLSAVFFFTSTVSSHLVEVFVGLINSRGRQLRARLESALGQDVAQAIYDDPIIKSLSNQSRRANHPPSYIEPDMFARVVAGLSKTVNNPVSTSDVINDIKDKLVTGHADFEPKLIGWFKAVNDRQAGVYTRWTFLRLLVVGFLLAGVMDIDTIHIAATLWENPEQAEHAAKALDDARKITDKGEALTDADKAKLRDLIATTYTQLRATVPPNYAWQRPLQAKDVPVKVLGWLLTALATSLGAQFWFNIMSETLKLRAAGRKPDDESKAKGDQQKPAGGGAG